MSFTSLNFMVLLLLASLSFFVLGSLNLTSEPKGDIWPIGVVAFGELPVRLVESPWNVFLMSDSVFLISFTSF